MSTIMPKDEGLRKAVKWISEKLQNDPEASLMKLIGEASFKFDLSPKDGQFLMNFYNNKDKDDE